MNLSKDVTVTRVLNAVAAGTTVQNGAAVDMAGFDGVLFIALLGALSATQTTSLKAQHGDLANGSDGVDLAGSGTGNMPDAASNKALICDVFNPQKRYVRPVVVRGVANAVIDGVIAIQYRAGKMPTVQDISVALSKLVVGPVAGVA